eukprot:5226367-Prymnesium_polylepis.1
MVTMVRMTTIKPHVRKSRARARARARAPPPHRRGGIRRTTRQGAWRPRGKEHDDHPARSAGQRTSGFCSRRRLRATGAPCPGRA